MSMRSERVNEILAERQEIHGDANTNFTLAGKIWGALLGIGDIPAWQVALLMDAYKTVRCFANPNHEDNWQDKLGYTQHGLDIVNES